MEKIEKLNTTIQREIAKIIEKIDFNCLVTISKVETNDAKTKANIFISVFPFSKIEEVAKEIGSLQHKIQKEFNQLEIKTKPKLNFFIDPKAEEIDTNNKINI
ncbi:MAG: ribosome-binding factor A [Candidatus Pacebacteria bacterium]|nr:ribosome-binding factor A [Candidatus Paceibacterota bacterium]